MVDSSKFNTSPAGTGAKASSLTLGSMLRARSMCVGGVGVFLECFPYAVIRRSTVCFSSSSDRHTSESQTELLLWLSFCGRTGSLGNRMKDH